jgi:REP element-mobilizing transposase RayT
MIYEKGNYYHIYNRGCNKENIFYCKSDYYLLIKKITATYKKYGADLVSYCLMPNHYHFLVHQKTAIPLFRWIQTIFNGYTQTINKVNNRTGTLFESNAKPKIITNESYLLSLVNYIHFNPVTAGLVLTPENWKFSSYLDWIGKRKQSFINLELRNSHFTSPQKYKEFFLTFEETFQKSLAKKI